MAATITGLLKPWTPRVFLVRWSRYNPYYLEPEFSKEVYDRTQDTLGHQEKKALELKAHSAIKAAPNDASSSLFNDPLISKFTNMIMKNGQKVLAREIVTQALENIKRKQVEEYHKAPPEMKEGIQCDPYTIFHEAIENCKPVIGLVNIKKGGKTYQVPIGLTENKRRFMAMNWIITECRERKRRRTLMYEQLSEELLNAFNKESKVLKKREDLHKMAEANRAFAHYRWS